MPAFSPKSSMSIFYAALFSAFGIYMPFMPVWLSARGLGPQEIAACMALPMLTRLLVPFWGLLADRLGHVRGVIIAVLAAALLLGAGLNFAHGFWPILGLMLLMSLFWTPALPLTDSMALQQCERENIDYGRVRLWGSFAFMLASVMAGVVLDWLAPGHILALILAFVGVALGAATLLPSVARTRPQAARVKLSGILALMRDGSLMRMFMAAGLVQASHAMFYVLGSVHWRGQGIEPSLIGWLWATGVIAETLLFAYSARLTGRATAERLVLFGGLIAMARWLLFALSPDPAGLFFLQVLHAGSFGLTHIGTMRFISQSVPDDLSATGQGLFTALSAGILMGLAMLATGPIYASLGDGVWLVMSAIAATGVALLAFSPRGQTARDA